MKNSNFTPGTKFPLSLGSPSMDGANSAARTWTDVGRQPTSCLDGHAVFHCSLNPEGEHWTASLDILFRSPRMCEAVAQGRSTTFHLIVGRYRDGNFLCVPSHGFGCELSDLSDTFWNSERIRPHLRPVDSATLVAAVACLGTLWPVHSQTEGRRNNV